jgi:NitT/TauT family transport system substrate-binding protein
MRLDPAGVPLLNLGRRGIRAHRSMAALSGLALLLAAGCSASSSAGGAVPGTIVIAAEPGVSNAAIYLARKDGLFAAEGLSHVEIRSYANQAAVLTALQSGQADIAAADYGDIFYQQAQSRTHDLRILADGYDATASVLEILTLPNSSITSPLGLVKAGVKVGLPNDDLLNVQPNAGIPPSLDAAAATSVLTGYMVQAQADTVQWDAMSQQQEVQDLQNHTLQAILVSEPYIYEAESELGAVEVLDACSGSTAGLPLLGYVAMSPWVKDQPGAVADFQAALAKAQTDASLEGQVQAVLPSAAGMTVQDADLITVGSYPTATSRDSLEQVVTLMQDNNIFKGTAPPPVPPMLVNSKG